MGFFGEIRSSIEAAQSTSADDAIVASARRIDTLVTDPTNHEHRLRTDYAGTIWFGGRPELTAVRSMGREVEIRRALRLPDSHGYEPSVGENAQIQASVAVQGALATRSAGGTFHILEADAGLGQGSEDSTLFVHLSVGAVATLPLGLAYRVTVVCDPAGLRPASD